MANVHIQLGNGKGTHKNGAGTHFWVEGIRREDQMPAVMHIGMHYSLTFLAQHLRSM